MKKLTLMSLAVFSFATDLRYALHQNHAYSMPKNKTLITAEYQKLNNTIDVLKLKEQELGSSAAKYGAIGDLTGYKFGITYGMLDKLTLNANIAKQDIEYGAGTLTNKRFETFARYNFYQNFFAQRALSIDIGMITDKADDLSYSNKALMENMAKKLINAKSVTINPNNIKIKKQDGSLDVLTITQKPEIISKDMQDTSIYLKLLNEHKIATATYVTYFIKGTYTKIKTTVTANDELVKIAKTHGYDLVKNLDRDEKALSVGFNFSAGTKWIFEFEYYYTRFFRDKGLDYINYNHVINMDLIKPINKRWFIFAGGKIMYRQFNGEIPYLYNKYSQTTFDHKYGYARAGVGFIF